MYLQYSSPQEMLHTIDPHPVSTPWNMCPLMDIIPHIVSQTIPVSFNSIDPMPEEPPGECNRSTWLIDVTVSLFILSNL